MLDNDDPPHPALHLEDRERWAAWCGFAGEKGFNMKKRIREIRPYVTLYRDTNSGIAWVEDGTSGNGHSAHPNIHATGSVAGMRKLGYWGEKDRAVKSHGFIHNVDRLVVTDELDKIAAEACCCVACSERRAKD